MTKIPYWAPHSHAPQADATNCGICGERLDAIPPLAATRSERIATLERRTGLTAQSSDNHAVVAFMVRNADKAYVSETARRICHNLVDMGYMASYGQPTVSVTSRGQAIWVADVSVCVGE